MRKRRFLSDISLGIFLCFLIWGTEEMTALAEASDFVIEANKLSADEETYNIQVSIENQGEDWEGTARLATYENSRYPTVYDTVIALPGGSTKQFVVKVPKDSLEDSQGDIRISLWDKKFGKVAEKDFKRFLADGDDMLSMGILSDEYSSLTYLDMGGDELYYYGDSHPIKLTELTKEMLVDELETMDFLVIDTYNTGILNEEELKAIETWNYDGGVLIVGTGSYAEDTLSGLGEDYLKIKSRKIFAPEEISDSIYSDEMDLSRLHIAELQDMDGWYSEIYLSKGYACPLGDGAVGVLPYALTEVATMDESFYKNSYQESMVLNLLEEVSSYANSRFDYNSHSDTYNNYTLGRLLRMVGNANNTLNFTVLNILVIVYVIFVGPVLYLILHSFKKRDFYWITVPVSALLGVIVISFAGRGFEVVNAKVYSVTMENLSGKGSNKTYMYCYDAGHKEWELQLAEGYDYVGAMMNDNYIFDVDEDDYYHHMKKEGDTLSFGIKPGSNFEDSFFCAGKDAAGSEAESSITAEGISSGMAGIKGTVTNLTGHDFLYYAVIVEDTLYVYENLPTGESVKLAGQTPVYNSYQGYDMWGSYVYDFLVKINDEEPEKVDIAAALGVGVCCAYPSADLDATVVIGVTEDWVKAVDDECSETSYGCLYMVW